MDLSNDFQTLGCVRVNLHPKQLQGNYKKSQNCLRFRLTLTSVRYNELENRKFALIPVDF